MVSVSANDLQFFSGVQHLAETRRFKAWFLDQFGVLHDGKKPYQGAISTLEKLAKTGAKMVVISNSSRRASVTTEKLRNLGFDPNLFLGSITSGELTHQYLERLSIFIVLINEFERHYGCPAHYFLDSKPRRNAASSSKNLHGKEEDRKRKQVLQPLGADKRGKGGSLETCCSDAALSDESPSEGKGSSTSGMEEKRNLRTFVLTSVDCDEEIDRTLEKLNENGPHTDIELIMDHIGWSYMTPEECTRKPQICRIYVEGKSWEKSDYIKLLKEIDCDHRFLACSLENSSFVFFAKLTKSEAAKLQGVKRVIQVYMYETFIPSYR